MIIADAEYQPALLGVEQIAQGFHAFDAQNGVNNEWQNEQAEIIAEQEAEGRDEEEKFLSFDLLEVGDEGPVRFSDPEDRSLIESKMKDDLSRGLFRLRRGKNNV